MKKFAIPALAAAMALAACGEAEAPEAEGDTVVVEEPAATESVMTDPVATDDEGSSVTIDGADVDATISEDGVQAEIDAE